MFCYVTIKFYFNELTGSVTPQEVVDAHNKYRGIAVSKNGALNMMKMIWDPEVAMVAQRWAENCKTEHDGNRERFIPGNSQYTRLNAIRLIRIQNTDMYKGKRIMKSAFCSQMEMG